MYLENRTLQKRYGNCMGGLVASGKVASCMRVMMGAKGFSMPQEVVLDTIAHEYCHVLQHDVHNFGTDPAKCIEADAFAVRIVPEFLSKDV